MAPSKKPLFGPPPPTTLDHFFTKPETSNSRNASSRVKKRVTSRHLNSQTRQRTNLKRVHTPGAEIIVLDSDDDNEDDDTHTAGTKRNAEDHAGSSSDVEVVGAIPQPLHDVPSSKKAKVTPRTNPFDVGTDDPLAFAQDDTRHFSEFGRPLLLVHTDDNVPSVAEDQNFQVASSSRSGDNDQQRSRPATKCPTLSADSDDSRRESHADSSNCLPARLTQEASCEVIEIEEEWGTGDDELVRTSGAEVDGVIEFADEEEIEEVLKCDDEPFATSEDIFDQCPFCGVLLTSFSSLDVQSHIAACCDSFSTTALLVAPTSPCNSPPPSEPSGSNASGCSNAFSILMSSNKENNAWKEAETVEDRNFRPTKANGGRRKAPFYKVLQGMPIAVDAFRYGEIPGVTSYFLTHAHSDHYTNLSSSWKAGPIYCSGGTANLVVHMLSVDPKWVHPLPLDVPTLVPGSGGVTVTLIEANHCPGSSLFLFEGPQTVNAGDSTYKSSHVGSGRIFRYLHCGDFRASPQHALHQAIKGKRIDIIYLDTTYLNPRYLFPAQAQVISACVELAKRLVSGQRLACEDDKGSVSNWITFTPKPEPKGDPKVANTLVVVGTYSIGKERIVKALAKALHTKVYCDSRKAGILRCQSDPELDEMLTSDPFSANVHLVPLGVATSDRLKEYIGRWKGHWTKAIAFRPTGWTYSPPAGTSTTPSIASILAHPPHREFTHTQLRPARGSTPTAQLFGVPYSEHSSFFELTCFALSLDWARIVATVNVESAASRAKISAWIARWEAERRKRSPGSVVPYRTLEYW